MNSSSTGFGTAQRLDLNPSRRLTLLLGFTHMGALLLLPLTNLPLWIIGPLCLAVVFSAYRLNQRHAALAHGRSVVELQQLEGEKWRLLYRDGSETVGSVAQDSYATGWMIILNIKTAWKRPTQSVPILPDMLDGDSYRRLLVWLRYINA